MNPISDSLSSKQRRQHGKQTDRNGDIGTGFTESETGFSVDPKAVSNNRISR